jgi:putative protease
MNKKVELLSPAGNLENLKIAFTYGADAVYLSGKNFGLRAKADNFTLEEIREGAEYAHKISKKVYVTLNIIAHNEDLKGLDEFIRKLKEFNVDAVIAADPGVISIIQETAPTLPIHLSTQANNVNYKSAEFWHKLGIKRITLARELSGQEIKEIINKTPKSLEVETFVHGAICVSYSGRCMLSKYMTDRDANLGECTHPCRYKYSLQEEKRPGEYFDVYEDDKGSYIINSKDLCLIKQLPELIGLGVKSFKIEGRMKGSYYVALITSIYRKVIDSYYKDPENYVFDEKLFNELEKINHRGYTTGFFNKKPGVKEYVYDSTGYTFSYLYIGLVLEYEKETKLARISVQNKICVGDVAEIIGPDRDFVEQKIESMFNEDMSPIQVATIGKSIIYIKVNQPVKPSDILRINNKGHNSRS